MLHHIFTSRWFIGSSIFLIVMAALFCVWTLHDLASFKKRMSITDDIILQEDKSQEAQNKVQGDGPRTIPLDSMKNQSKSVEDTSVPTEETTLTTDTVDKNANIDLTADKLTSPFGFGPYPDVPADYPVHELLWDNATPEHELLVRVEVKLWKQGTQTKGSMFDPNNGLIYPTIPGVLYVQWRYIEEGDPDLVGRRYAGRVMGDGETAEKWQSLYLTERMFERTDVKNDPEVSGIKIYEYPDGGIDPYQFLDLPR